MGGEEDQVAIVQDHTKWCSDPARIRETLDRTAEEKRERYLEARLREEETVRIA